MRQENMTREIGPRLSVALAKQMVATKGKSRSKRKSAGAMEAVISAVWPGPIRRMVWAIFFTPRVI